MNQEEITYSQEVTKAHHIAQKIGRENLNANYSGAHLLKAMLNRDLSLLKHLENLGVDVFYLEEWAEVRIEESPKSPNKYSCEPDEIIDEIFAEADAVRELLSEQEITLFAVMVGISSPGVAFNFDQMKTFPVSRNELLKDISTFGASEMTGTAELPKKQIKDLYKNTAPTKKIRSKRKTKKNFWPAEIPKSTKLPRFFADTANKMY